MAIEPEAMRQILAAPVARRLPQRTINQVRADDACLRMLHARTIELKLLWAGRMVAFRKSA